MNNQKQYMILLLKFFLIIHKTLILQGFRLLWNKRDHKMRTTWTHLMVSDTFYFIVDDTFFCPKGNKPYCPLTLYIIQTLRLRDLSGCFSVHICAFCSSYSSYFAFLCTSSKFFRAKMEPYILLKKYVITMNSHIKNT